MLNTHSYARTSRYITLALMLAVFAVMVGCAATPAPTTSASAEKKGPRVSKFDQMQARNGYATSWSPAGKPTNQQEAELATVREVVAANQ